MDKAYRLNATVCSAVIRDNLWKRDDGMSADVPHDWTLQRGPEFSGRSVLIVVGGGSTQLVVTVDDYEVLNNVQDFINLHQLPVALGERVSDFVISSWSISRGIDADKVYTYPYLTIKGI